MDSQLSLFQTTHKNQDAVPIVNKGILEVSLTNPITKVGLQKLYRAFLRDEGGNIPVKMICNFSEESPSHLNSSAVSKSLGSRFCVSGKTSLSSFINDINGVVSHFIDR